MIPIMQAEVIETQSAPAVIPTKPAKQPLSTIERSGFFCTNHEVNIADIRPKAAERAVVVKTYATITGFAEKTDAPLNPNHPNQSRNTPKVAKPRLLPGIA